MTNEQLVIERCTRNGVTAWQAAAKQLGCSVDYLRAKFDVTYARAYCWAPSREPDPELEPPVDENDTSSPHVKGPGLKLLILCTLQNGPLSAETLACVLVRTVNSIRARLDRLHDVECVVHDGRYPRTWKLTAKGLRCAVTRCEISAKERV